MKTIKTMILVLAALTTAWGCASCGDDNDDNKSGQTTFLAAAAPTWSVDMTSSDTAPTWTAPDPTKFENSMFVLVKLQDELKAYSSEDDLMAVFIGDECRTVPASPSVSEDDGSVYFVLKIRGNNTDHDVKLLLRYYCAKLHQMFSIDGHENFSTEHIYGVEEDYVPPILSGSSKFPVQQNLTVSLPTDSGSDAGLPFTPTETDRVAVFVGGVCRGTGHVGQAFTVFRTTTSEELTLQYYSADKGGIYTLNQPVNLSGADNSVTLNF